MFSIWRVRRCFGGFTVPERFIPCSECYGSGGERERQFHRNQTGCEVAHVIIIEELG